MTTVTSAPFISLGLPEPADKMDISSPYNRNLDDFDIDIDIPPRPSDEDFILEDLRSDTGIDLQADQAGDIDDFMFDEERQSVLSEDRTMRDDDTVQDEHLTDASDMGLEENASNESGRNVDHQIRASPIAEENKGETAPDTREGVKDTSPETESTVLHHRSKEPNMIADNNLHDDDLEADNSNEQNTEAVAAGDLDDFEAGLSAEGELADEIEESDHTQVDNKDESKLPLEKPLKDCGDFSWPANNDGTSERSELPETLTKNENDKIITNFDTTVPSTSTENIVSRSPITPLHPIVIHYDGNELSLFPPSDNGSSETFLLDDENLVNVSIADLLRACRVVLGETFDEVDELVLRIEALGISLSEECLHAASTSFNDILNVYTKLKQLDGAEKEPLYVILSSKPRFSVRFQALQAAVSHDRGLSQVPFLAKDIKIEPDEEEGEEAAHSETYDAEEQLLQDDHESQQPHDASSNIPSSEVNINEKDPPGANQMLSGENEERGPSQILSTDGNDTDDVDNERIKNDEPLERNTTTNEDLQTSEYIEEDDLIIYADGDNNDDSDEGGIDLPQQGAATSEHPVESAESAESDNLTSHTESLATGTKSFDGDTPYSSNDIAADFTDNDITDHDKLEKVTNNDIPEDEPERDDENHSEERDNTIYGDQDEDAAYQGDSSYDAIGNPEDFSRVTEPLDVDKKIEPIINHSDTINEETVCQYHPVNQESDQSTGADIKITAGDNAQTEAQLHEDALLLESDAILQEDSLDDPEYRVSSTSLEIDRRSLSAENEDNAAKERAEDKSIDTTTAELQANQANGESVNSDHYVEELKAVSRTNSPSAKRLRSDDLEDSLEGEEITIDNKRIRSS